MRRSSKNKPVQRRGRPQGSGSSAAELNLLTESIIVSTEGLVRCNAPCERLEASDRALCDTSTRDMLWSSRGGARLGGDEAILANDADHGRVNVHAHLYGLPVQSMRHESGECESPLCTVVTHTRLPVKASLSTRKGTPGIRSGRS